MKSITINSFSLSIHGLCVNYSTDKERFDFFLDPKATVDLFEDLHIIEGFDFDKNNEPVILYTENIGGRKTTGFCFWCDFVRTFGFIQRHAEIIADHHHSQHLHRSVIAKINALLSPIQQPEFVLA